MMEQNSDENEKLYQQIKQLEEDKNAAKSNLSIALLGLVSLGISVVSVGLGFLSSIICCVVGLFSVIKNKPKRGWAIIGMIFAGFVIYLNIFYVGRVR